MNETDAKKRFIYGALLGSLILAACVLLILQEKAKPVLFPEFSASDALDGGADCYLNALQVLDRYAEEPDRKNPSELLLVSYRDRDENEVLLSLLVEPDEALYARLSPYYAGGEAKREMFTLSGYFFCEPLNAHNKGATSAFDADAQEYIAWKGEEGIAVNPVVLRFAGTTEADYEAARRGKNLGNVLTVVVLFVLAAACGVRLLTLKKKTA